MIYICFMNVRRGLKIVTGRRFGCIVFAFSAMLCLFSKVQAQLPFKDESLPVEKRLDDLLGRLTLEQKISLLGYQNKAIPALNMPAYNWWNEALHGVARAGMATVFPQAIALAATFNDELMWNVADAISTEARAKYNVFVARDSRIQYGGLTFWSPNVNIFRDPRWGRGQETYGEDPYLTAKMGLAFVRGMQGNDATYLKTAACAKHYAVHSGPEKGRHAFNAIVDEKDLRETYLYAFKKLVDGGVESVMCAYNRTNGEPCCISKTLLTDILLKEWNFGGHVVTDCGALYDIIQHHKLYDDPVAVAAMAIKAGVNLDCANLLQSQVEKAFERNLLSMEEIDGSLRKLLQTQFKLGMYDDAQLNPYSQLGEKDIHTRRNIELARKAAQQSMVLLKNDKGLLPLSRDKYRSIMVLGANSGAMDPMVANYHGMSGNIVTFAEGITAGAGAGIAVQYDMGSDFHDTARLGGIWAAGESDISIAVIGLTPVYEGEEGDAFLAANGGDKLTLDLPDAHIALLRKLREKNKPVIAVVTAGSNVDISAIEAYADAVILAWYPGEQGGNALADLIFGDVSPSGRLPVTFYKSLEDLPPYDSYDMRGRTYRYFAGDVQYPFGFGLSYANFEYAWRTKPGSMKRISDTLYFSIAVKNSSTKGADEVAQVYIQYPDVPRMPVQELKAYRRVTIPAGETRDIRFQIPVSELLKWDLAKKKWILYPGTYHVQVGSHSRDIRLEEDFRISK